LILIVILECFMYGLVNKALRDLVIAGFGQATWDEIRQRAGVETDIFIGSEGYDDTITYNLVGAASEVTGKSASELLHAFGEHWVLKTARDGYGGLMDTSGRNFVEFLTNLPNLHRRVGLIFPKLQPPRFEVTGATDSSLLLHYRTHRPGLSDFVVGLLSGLGKMFETEVKVTQTEFKSAGADHDVFLVEWVNNAGATSATSVAGL